MAWRLKGPPRSLDSSKKKKVLGVDAEERSRILPVGKCKPTEIN